MNSNSPENAPRRASSGGISSDDSLDSSEIDYRFYSAGGEPGANRKEIPFVKYGEKRTEGSAFDSYETVRLIGGTEYKESYVCKRKSRENENKDREEGFWSKLSGEGTHKEFVLQTLRINSLDEDWSGSSHKALFGWLDKVKDMRNSHIARIYEYYERHGKVHMIMEHCVGGNLLSKFPYSEPAVIRIISAVLSGLQALHDSEMLHLALTMESIQFTSSNPKRMDLKISDLGIESWLARQSRREGTSDPSYAEAPESMKGIFSAQSDIWSIGVISFILLSGQLPFPPGELRESISRARYNFGDAIWSRISREAKDFIFCCLQLDPNRRMTLQQAKKHRWISAKLPSGAIINSLNTDEKVEKCLQEMLNAVAFKARAANIIAGDSTMERIVNIAQRCVQSDKDRTGLTTYGRMKVVLEKIGFQDETVTSIFNCCQFDDEAPLEYRDFLAATLEVRGALEENLLAAAFESSFPAENSLISKFEVAGLLTSVGSPERVEEFFSDMEGDKRLTFKEFLFAFHQKTTEYAAKIASSKGFSISSVLELNSMSILHGGGNATGCLEYEKEGLLGGSELSAVYLVNAKTTNDEFAEEAAFQGRKLPRFLSLLRNESPLQSGKTYAMKAFRETSPEAEFDLRTEIHAIRNLNHKNIAQIYDSFVDRSQVHIVMELCDGGNLASRIPFKETEAARVVLKLLSALKCLHSHGIVHAALNMETVLFDSGAANAEIKIINHGLSRKLLSGSRLTSEEEDESLYAASPESFRGVYTSKGDMWSVGVITYYLLSGEKPFWGKRWYERLRNADVDFESGSWGTISKEAKTFIRSLLQLNVSDRPDPATASNYMWLVKSSLPLKRRFRASEVEQQDEYRMREESFKRIAINVVANRLTDEQIIAMRNNCLERGSDFSVVSYACLKEMLSDNEFGDIVKAIEERNVVSDPSFDPRNVAVLLIIDQAFYDDCELNIVEFLHASLSARGHVLHDRFDMEFRKNGSRTQTSHRLSRERVAGMLEPIGAYVDADDIFIRASHHDDRCISFEEFLRIFREARSKTLLSKIDGEIISMTSAVSVAQETKRAPKAGYTGNHLSFDMVERLGGNSSVIIEISTKSERGMADEHPTILHDGHRRVLKVFRLNQFNDVVASKVKCELMQELKTLQKMRHTGIVRIHDVSQHFSHIRVTEELCRGGTLRDRVPLTESRAARITGEILAALSYMHSQKIVHQALSLTSVMFVTPSEDSPIKLISLGHSHKCQPREEMVVSAGDWWRLYTCSPEIISGHHFTEKSDMWSVGVIAFALISGYVPFSGSDVKKKIVNGEFTFEKLLWEKKSQCSQDFVETLLKLDPTWRPTAKRAMNHRWFRQRRNSSGFSDPQHTDDTNLFNEMRTELDFRRDAENILAFNMTVPEIFQLERMICNGAKCRKGYVSYGEFKKVLEDSKVSDKLISRIFRNINLAYDDGFEYDDFLDKIIIDCARIVEVKLAVDFEMLESRDVSREEIQELMGNQFEFLRVDEIFNSLEDNEHQLSFSRFLHLYDSHIENLPNLLKQVGTEDECTSQTSNNISIDD